MSFSQGEIATQYLALLRRHLREEGEETLRRAYDLGREALENGSGILHFVEIQHQAVLRVLREEGAAAEILRSLEAAKALFVESLSTYEMTHQTTREASAAWRRLNESLETEARRIAHALHDEAGQLIATAHIALDELARGLSPKNQLRLQETRKILEQIESQLRRISHELRPTMLDDLGLVPALEYLAEGISKRGGLEVQVVDEVESRLPSGHETALYRIVQEALTNVNRHAQARSAFIRLRRQGDEVVCTVRDDGVGFDVPGVLEPGGKGGLGLIGIRERVAAAGGSFAVRSAKGAGTELRITLPMESQNGTADSRR